MITAIGGEPATGKTALVWKYLKLDWQFWKQYRSHSVPHLYNATTLTYVLGVYDKKEVFSGTDRLSFAIQKSALAFMQKIKGNIIFEGDRLFNSEVLETLKSDNNLRIMILESSEEKKQIRMKSRILGSQDPRFLKSRKTKIMNIKRNPKLVHLIRTFQTEDCLEKALSYLIHTPQK